MALATTNFRFCNCLLAESAIGAYLDPSKQSKGQPFYLGLEDQVLASVCAHDARHRTSAAEVWSIVARGWKIPDQPAFFLLLSPEIIAIEIGTFRASGCSHRLILGVDLFQPYERKDEFH